MSDRYFEISNICCGSSGCCGLDELYGFVSDLYDKADKDVTEKEWLNTLVGTIEVGETSVFQLGPIVMFSGSSEQEKCKFSPHALAAFLIDQGENVASTARVRNGNSGNMIQAFLWTPSRRFKNKLTATQKKNNKESDNKPRANVA